jgi:hypothetical protein
MTRGRFRWSASEASEVLGAQDRIGLSLANHRGCRETWLARGRSTVGVAPDEDQGNERETVEPRRMLRFIGKTGIRADSPSIRAPVGNIRHLRCGLSTRSEPLFQRRRHHHERTRASRHRRRSGGTSQSRDHRSGVRQCAMEHPAASRPLDRSPRLVDAGTTAEEPWRKGNADPTIQGIGSVALVEEAHGGCRHEK